MSHIRKDAFEGLIAVVYRNYVEEDRRIVLDGQVFWVPTAEVFSHRKYQRTRDDTKHSDEAEGRKRWDELYSSMRQNGYDKRKPVVFEIQKGAKLRISDGNHRAAVASMLGLPLIAVQFEFR